jgi:hypothetical protein
VVDHVPRHSIRTRRRRSTDQVARQRAVGRRCFVRDV